MKIAIFDHLVDETNAIGKCHRQLLMELADEHEFTVFAIRFDNPRPDRINYIKVPALSRPLLGLMVSFHIIAPIILWWYRSVKGMEFDLVQGIGGSFVGADLAYGHFCHSVYLKDHKDSRPSGWIRKLYTWLFDVIVASLEPYSFGWAKHIVTPSEGLARELIREFPGVTESKVQVIANPINVENMKVPEGHDASITRRELGFSDEDMVMVFVATGHFERKGLPVLLDAMQAASNKSVKLIVVGGREYLINEYRGIAATKGLQDQIAFVGFQLDIRPYLWASDIFAFPSAYETFSLVSFEAAAASLPILVSRLHGVEELIQEGHNGWEVERTAEAVKEKILYAVAHRDELKRMGENAARSVIDYTPQAFGEKWKSFYDKLSPETLKKNLSPVQVRGLKTE